jgi:hypothetical protein
MTQTSTPQTAAATPAPASVVDGARLTDALFSPPVEADKPAPMVNAEDLAQGAIVLKKGERPVKFRREGKERTTTVHIFASVAQPDRWFSLWGSQGLDSQLRKVRPGAALLLRYTGKRNLDDGTGREVHTWEIRQTSANPAQLQQLLGTAEWQPRVQALDLAITQATQREAERRAAGGSSEPEPPPHTDADAPVTWAKP